MIDYAYRFSFQRWAILFNFNCDACEPKSHHIQHKVYFLFSFLLISPFFMAFKFHFTADKRRDEKTRQHSRTHAGPKSSKSLSTAVIKPVVKTTNTRKHCAQTHARVRVNKRRNAKCARARAEAKSAGGILKGTRIAQFDTTI